MEYLFSSLSSIDSPVDTPALVFKNHVPARQSLQPRVKKVDTLVADLELATERLVFHNKKEFLQQQEEPLTLVPRQPNMDLKRMLDRKVNKLSKRTEEAVLALIKLKPPNP